MYVCIFLSADLFQSESVLAYIVIHPYLAILQNPISHIAIPCNLPFCKLPSSFYLESAGSDCIILKGIPFLINRVKREKSLLTRKSCLFHLQCACAPFPSPQLIPGDHLQSAIIAIYLYCKMHLALLHHLRGVG